jgi:hypothetical protein
MQLNYVTQLLEDSKIRINIKLTFQTTIVNGNGRILRPLYSIQNVKKLVFHYLMQLYRATPVTDPEQVKPPAVGAHVQYLLALHLLSFFQ